jgi:hypothetical protein
MPESLKRPDFPKAAVAAGPAVIAAHGANEKINVGWIGVGRPGSAVFDWLNTASANAVQVTRAQDRLKTTCGGAAKVHFA